MIAEIQGIYYLITGLWPVFNIKSFEKVTGPKTDKWLVKTFGIAVAAVGVILITYEDDYIKPLGVLIAASLAVFETYYSFKGVISKVYLIDAAFHVAIIAGWLLLV